MTNQTAAVLAIAWLLLVASPTARALTLLADERSVMTRTEVNQNPPPTVVVETPDSAFAPFHVDLGVASQDSEIDLVTGPGPVGSLSAMASGSAFGSVRIDSTYSKSTFSIRFRVDAPATVDLRGVLDLTSSFATASVTLRAGSTVLYERFPDQDPVAGFTTPFQFATLLAAGDHQITADAVGSGGLGSPGRGIFSLAVTVSEVPEPQPALPVALGLAGLAWLRRAARDR